MNADTPLLRAYLKSVKPAIELPQALSPNVTLRAAPDAPPMSGVGDSIMRENVPCTLDVHGIEERLTIVHAINAVTAIRIASKCSVVIVGYLTQDGTTLESTEGDVAVWGHHEANLSASDIEFVRENFTAILEHLSPERYSRFANAMRLHAEAMQTRNADFALLGFVGALESLFSIAPQELTFRLSLLMAKFLGATGEEQRAFFKRAKDLYKIRSKIAHGDRIAPTEESAAIQIVENWTPEAEELARISLRRVLQYKLPGIFNSASKHEQLLTELLFEKSLDDAMLLVPAE